jgi:hypothetical protein
MPTRCELMLKIAKALVSSLEGRPAASLASADAAVQWFAACGQVATNSDRRSPARQAFIRRSCAQTVACMIR